MKERGTQVQKEKMAMNKYLSTVTLNANGLNAQIKRHRVVECIGKHDPHTCCLKEIHLKTKDLHRLKGKGWKKILQGNGQDRKSSFAILFQTK